MNSTWTNRDSRYKHIEVKIMKLRQDLTKVWLLHPVQTCCAVSLHTISSTSQCSLGHLQVHFESLPCFWTEFHDSFCIMFGFSSAIQSCMEQLYPVTKSSTNEVNILKLISLLSFCMLMDKREILQTLSDHQSEDKTEKTGSISDTLQMIYTGG